MSLNKILIFLLLTLYEVAQLILLKTRFLVAHLLLIGQLLETCRGDSTQLL